MGVARAREPIEPLPQVPAIDHYAGQWVAVKDGRVVASARRARDLVVLVRAMGEDGADATVEFAAALSNSFRVGLG